MSSQFARRLFRASARASKPRTFTAPAGKRSMSAASHTASKGSDTPWILGSVAIFGPAFAYTLFSGSDSSHAHHADDSHGAKHAEHTPVPTKDDEGTEVPKAEVASSMKQAETADDPVAAQSSSGEPSAEPVKDDEGAEASGEDVKASNAQAASEDSPKDAQSSEAKEGKSNQFAGGAPGQTEESETNITQKVTPREDSSPAADLGQARKRSSSGEAPKTVDSKQDEEGSKEGGEESEAKSEETKSDS